MNTNTTSVAQALNKAAADQALVNGIAAIGIPVKPARVRKVAKGTMAELAVAKPTVITVYTDPLDIIEDKLGLHSKINSRVLESMAWLMDSMCITQARTVLFARYKEIDSSVQGAFEEFLQDVAENLDHPSLYEEDSNELTLAIMLALRTKWHDDAYHAVEADGRTYEPKSPRVQMESEKVKAPDVGTRANNLKSFMLETRNDAEAANRMVEAVEAQRLIVGARRVANNKDLINPVLEIFRTVSRYADQKFDFSMLPANKQKTFFNFANSTTEAKREELAERLAKQPMEYARIAEAVYQCKLAVDRVLATKFNGAEELENVRSQVEMDIDRREKRAAWNSFE